MIDEDEDKDKILEMLGGEVDDYAGSQLKNPDEKGQGVTIEISVKPHGEEKEPDGDEVCPACEGKGCSLCEGSKEGLEEEHDPIAHILGMCGGGCAK